MSPYAIELEANDAAHSVILGALCRNLARLGPQFRTVLSDAYADAAADIKAVARLQSGPPEYFAKVDQTIEEIRAAALPSSN